MKEKLVIEMEFAELSKVLTEYFIKKGTLTNPNYNRVSIASNSTGYHYTITYFNDPAFPVYPLPVKPKEEEPKKEDGMRKIELGE